ncbi:hypothetical protein Lalb_Chr22g0361551 [Lupinus albus]|uniref:Late nodulin n=1 Tax=Lupinus albus TaxID=3870 RepID=A0A6A4NE21_LUPAL|nr:hypothetical protein Lalb_Chr22g0361551 [Lupinus albus]
MEAISMKKMIVLLLLVLFVVASALIESANAKDPECCKCCKVESGCCFCCLKSKLSNIKLW